VGCKLTGEVRNWLSIQVFPDESIQLDRFRGTFEEANKFVDEIEHNLSSVVIVVEEKLREALKKLDSKVEFKSLPKAVLNQKSRHDFYVELGQIHALTCQRPWTRLTFEDSDFTDYARGYISMLSQVWPVPRFSLKQHIKKT